MGFCERETRLGAAHLDGAVQHNPRRAYIALPEQRARTPNQPCRHCSFLGIGLSIAPSARRWCPVGDWIRALLDGLVPRDRTDRHDIGRNTLRKREIPFEPFGSGALLLQLRRAHNFCCQDGIESDSFECGPQWGWPRWKRWVGQSVALAMLGWPKGGAAVAACR